MLSTLGTAAAGFPAQEFYHECGGDLQKAGFAAVSKSANPVEKRRWRRLLMAQSHVSFWGWTWIFAVVN
jgi:hypothetical protein